METNRYDSPTVHDLRVVGSFESGGKVIRQKRCWATFKASENTSASTNANGAQPTGTRLMLVPARVFDYALSQPNVPVAFQPPPNARIVGFSIAGKTPTDQGILASMSTLLAAYPAGNSSVALGVQRCPLGSSTGVDDAKFRDTTKDFALRASKFNEAAATPARILLDPTGTTSLRNTTAGSMTADVTSAGTSNENPYFNYYQFLSPITNAGIAAANRHIGVIYEGVDATLKLNGGGPIRFVWDAPPAVGPKDVASPGAITATNPGLALVLLLSTNRGSGGAAAVTSTTADYFYGNQISDLTVDITFELEYDKNNDLQNINPLATAWNMSDLQGVLE